MKLTNVVSIAVLTLGLLSVTGCSKDDISSQAFVTEEKFAEILEKTLEDNPEIILKSFLKARQRQMSQQEANLSNILYSMSENPGAGPVLGAARSQDTVNIVLFEDYNCAFCKKQHAVLSGILKDNTNVSVTVKNLPIFGDTSKMAALLALAAYDLSAEKYQKLNYELMNRKKITEQVLVKAAEQIGFESVDFDELYKKYQSQLNDNYSLAKQLQITGTPAMVINGELFRGLQTKDKLKGILEKQK